MTYIDLINRFWQLDIEAQFSGTEAKLYFALLHIANQLHWSKAELSIPNGRLLALVGCTKKTLTLARNKLIQYELIEYTKGNRNKCSGKYLILGEKNNPISNPKRNPNTTPKSNPKRDPKRVPYIRKDKIREDKDNTIRENVPYQKIISLFNETCQSQKNIKQTTTNRKKHIKARWQEPLLDNLQKWKLLFEKVEQSSFLKQAKNSNWFDFNWLIKNNENYVKVLEGKYDDRKGGNNGNNSAFNTSNNNKNQIKNPAGTSYSEAELQELLKLPGSR